jgi:hypothetical protein
MPKPLSREDQVLLRMLHTPPKPHDQMKVKKKPSRAKRATRKAKKLG